MEAKEYWLNKHARALEFCDEKNCFYSIDIFAECTELPKQFSYEKKVSAGDVEVLYTKKVKLEEGLEVMLVCIAPRNMKTQVVSIRVWSNTPLGEERVKKIKQTIENKLLKMECDVLA